MDAETVLVLLIIGFTAGMVVNDNFFHDRLVSIADLIDEHRWAYEDLVSMMDKAVAAQKKYEAKYEELVGSQHDDCSKS